MAESSSPSEGVSDWEEEVMTRRSKAAAASKKQRRANTAKGKAAVKPEAHQEGEGGDHNGVKMEDGMKEEAEGEGAGGAADDDMEDAAAGVAAKGPGDMLAALDGVADALIQQFVYVKQARAKAHSVLAAMDALPPAHSYGENLRIQAVEQQCRGLISMGCRDTEAQLHSTAITARGQTEELVKKLDMIHNQMNTLNQDENEEHSFLLNLPEFLWMSDDERIGIGGFLGFIFCIESLSSVSAHFHSLTTQQPAMHPTVELNRNPKPDTAAKWTELLSSCMYLHINNLKVTPSLVRLLEAMAATLREVRLHGAAPKGQDGCLRRDWDDEFGGGLYREPIKMQPRGEPLVFPHLRKAFVLGSWGQIAQDRDYQLPALTELGVVELVHYSFAASAAPRVWVERASAGLRSVVVERHATKRYLNDVGDLVKGTISASTLTNVSGVDYGGEDRFRDHVVALRNVQMTLPRPAAGLVVDDRPVVAEVDIVRGLHQFRTTCLAPNATETYVGDQRRRFPTRRWQMLLPPAPVELRLPLSGAAADLAPCLPTLEVLAAQAKTVILTTHASAAEESHAGVGAFVCGNLKELTIQRAPDTFTHPLPPYVVATPAVAFPAVEAVVVQEQGAGFYDGGVGSILPKLPSLERVTFSRTVAAIPHTKLCLIPTCVGVLATDGRPLTVAFHVTIGNLQKANSTSHYISWSLYGGEGGEGAGAGAGIERERGLMQSGRVSRIEVEISMTSGGGRASGLSESRAKEMHRSFAECVAEAFTANSCLDCVALTVRPPPRYNLLRVLSDASKGRFIVSPPDGDDSDAFEVRRIKHEQEE
ncbi:unnamed protein product [Vitrella brassicaformis CCMP3155]|uniref:Uncharacterized protein n=3 Tax=Vitrella brassicaformis TaxID=1169539 RepID=A0A0G4GTL4_VITBC|nr:unnamed protein product [Vitrella brassicaformis CCMP3155]|eukprot:CEM34090.1 unnamed protein product [Vitrella brassicaformis CCMP3155]